jgi:hypothetical protein
VKNNYHGETLLDALAANYDWVRTVNEWRQPPLNIDMKTGDLPGRSLPRAPRIGFEGESTFCRHVALANEKQRMLDEENAVYLKGKGATTAGSGDGLKTA